MTAVKSEREIGQYESLAVDPREVVSMLRAAVLNLTPEDIGLDSTALADSVWGVAIETAHPDAVVSVIALADGSVSLYVSDGTGCVGCGVNPEARTAGWSLLELAQHSLTLATPSNDHHHPDPGAIRFYFLTDVGLRSVEVSLESLNSVDAKLSALYFAGQRVVHVIERVGAGQSIEQEIRIAQMTATPPVLGTSTCLSVGSAVHHLRR